MVTHNGTDSPLVQNKDQDEKRSLQFLAFCVIVAAILFILIDAVAYFTGPTDASRGGTEASETAKPVGKTMPVLP